MVGESVMDGVQVIVGVRVTVAVLVAVGVNDAVAVAVFVVVGVEVIVGVLVSGIPPISNLALSNHCIPVNICISYSPGNQISASVGAQVTAL